MASPIGTITRDGRSGVIAADNYQCEWFSGQLVKLRNDRWFLLGGDQDGRILEVQGLNSLHRFEGKLTITPAETKAAADALAAWTAQQARAQSLVLAHCPGTAELGRYPRHQGGGGRRPRLHGKDRL